MKIKALLAIAGLLVLTLYVCAYTVDETEQVVITRFDKVQRTITTPGLKFKLPVIEKALVFPNNLQEWDGDPGQIPTKDKTYIWVNTFARWKIVDPVLFFKTVGYVSRAQQRLDEIIDPTVRNFITSNRLIEAVRNSNRELDTFEDLGDDANQETHTDRPARFAQVYVGRDKIDTGILTQAKPKLSNFGIELVDVKIKRVNYVEEVRKSVYDRMIAERKQIAQKFRSEGKGEAQKILGEKERELKRIESEAYRTAQEIKGKADAESTRLYAEAYGLDPEFYSFIKTLEVYNEALSENSSIILSTDSEIFKYMKGYEGNTSSRP
ncbi:protease modulator HflC [Desulfosarcina sp.]|uniref:protease modulator HflC n=1 Tax=Desulfosarcina sp. TaxID=2027861 RepID=UPI0029AAE405|nr:protease modulator HflC [Desulfosarcina sp.]MDX2453980.1 protease modulator HflC [Desulfosarcina sp.]MDX2491674.1 protease modulator HflC [Desulfosarcina sp.]